MFKDIIDAFTKSKLIKEAYEECGEMHHEVEEMFQASFDCFFGKCSLKSVMDEDLKVNRKLVRIRKKILEYLAVNTAPDLNAALELSAIAGEYERIGDYCKNIAELNSIYGVELKKNELGKHAKKLREIITEQFKAVHDAVRDEDEELAKKSDELNEIVKKVHRDIIKEVKEHPKMNAVEAAVYSSLATYCRRISSHLENISTVVTNPFPEMGFRLGDYADY